MKNAVQVEDDEMPPENPDSFNNLVAFVVKKQNSAGRKNA